VKAYPKDIALAPVRERGNLLNEQLLQVGADS